MSESASISPALKTGDNLGPYRITGFVGAGGMGEVYRAADRRLGRAVAIKILPLAYRADGERLRRFSQEARTMSRINHPNVVSIFDFGEHEDRPYIVTELLEGETLRSILQTEQHLTVRKVIEYGVQIARGLAAAHDSGIVHRDLKPANLFITRDGHLKILDFGLAKLLQPEWEADHPDADTISALSLPGTILGSAGYMSPEQVEARAVDHRSDIFSFGAIVYEMLAGRRAFAGSSIAATLGSIIKDQPPDVALLRPNAPPALVAIVDRCLEKREEDRFQSARDLAFALEELSNRSDASFSITAATRSAIHAAATQIQARPAISLSMLTLLVIAVIAVVAIRSGAANSAPVEPPLGALRMTKLTSSGDSGIVEAISPDGRYLIHDVVDERGRLQLMHIPTRSETTIEVGDDVVLAAKFSRDGNYIYYLAQTSPTETDLKRIAMFGGGSRIIARHASWGSLTFSPNGEKVAFIRNAEAPAASESALVETTSDGTQERVIARRPLARAFSYCSWSLDGVRIVCQCDQPKGTAAVSVEVDAVTGEQRELAELKGLAFPEWLDRDHLVGGNQALWRYRYADRVATRITNDLSHYLFAFPTADGHTVASIQSETFLNLWVAPLGSSVPSRQLTSGINTADGTFGLAVSKSGAIVYTSTAGEASTHLWVTDLAGATPKRITLDDSADEKWPDVSPDGSLVAFVRTSNDGGVARSDLWTCGIDGASPLQITRSGDVRNARFSADGKEIYFTRSTSDGDRVWVIESAGGEPRVVRDETAAGAAPSPDGRWLLVRAREHYELWPLVDGEPRRVVNYDGSYRRWRRDGKAFLFLRTNGDVWLYELATGDARPLFKSSAHERVSFGFDVSPDDRELVLSRRSERADNVLIEGL